MVENDAEAGLAEKSRLSRIRLARISSEAVLWFVGVVLVLAGSLYFTQSNWSAWDEPTRAMVAATGLLVYECLFVGTALFLAVRNAPQLPQRVLAGLGLGLNIIAAAAMANLISNSVTSLLAFILVVVSSLVVAAAGRVFAPGQSRPLLFGSALGLIAIVSSAGPGPIHLGVGYSVIIALSWLTTRTISSTSNRFERFSGALYFGYLMFAVSASLLAANTYDFNLIAPVVALIMVTVQRIDVRRGTGSTAGRIAVITLALLSMLLAFAGDLRFVGPRVIMLATSALATYALVNRGLGDDRRIPLILAVITGLFAYFFIPAPFDVVIELLLSSAKNALGYAENQTLPAAFYGLTFIPYLLLVWWMSRQLLRSGRKPLANAVGITLLVIAGGLLALAFTSTSDPRPVLFSLPPYAAAFYLESRRDGRRFLAHAASIVSAVWAIRGGWWLFPADLSGVALGLSATGLLWILVRRGDVTRAVQRPAEIRHGLGQALASVAIICWSMPITGPVRPAPAMALMLTALSFAAIGLKSRSRVAAGVSLILLVAVPLVSVRDLGSVHLTLCSAALLLTTLGMLLSRVRSFVRLPDAGLTGSRTEQVRLPCVSEHWFAAPDGEHPFARPALEFAPFFAIFAGLAAIPSSSFLTLLPVAVVLCVAAWTTGRPHWTVAATAALAALGGQSAADLHLPAAWGLLAVAIVIAVATRTIAWRGWTSRGGEKLDPFMKFSSTTLSLICAAVFLGSHPAVADFYLASLALFLAFATSGAQPFLAATLGLAVVTAAYDGLEPTLHRALGGGRAFAWSFFFATSAWITISFLLTRFSHLVRWKPVLAQAPSAKSASSLGIAGVILMGLIAAVACSWRHQTSMPIVALDVLLPLLGVALGYGLYSLRRSGPTAFALAICVPLALAAVAWIFGSYAAVVAASAAGALAVISLANQRHRAVFYAVGWSGLSICLLLTELRTADFMTGAVFGMIALACWTQFRRHRDPFRFSVAVLSAALCSTWLWFSVGHLLSTGRSALAILPFVASGLVIIALAIERSRHIDRTFAVVWVQVLTSVAFLITAASIGLVRADALESIGALERVWTLVTLAGIAGIWVVRAQRSGQVVSAVLAELAIFLIWVEIRTRTPSLGAVQNIDAYAMLIATFIFTGIHALARRHPAKRPFEVSARVMALLLPAAGALTVFHTSLWNAAAITALCSMTYAVVARTGVSRFAIPLATVAFNVSLLAAWVRNDVSDPQLYALPVGASLLFVGHIYRTELSENATVVIRIIALGAIYLSSFVSIMADEPVHSLVMACICVSGVLAGVLLKIRSYLYLGAGFLVVDLATAIVRFGLHGQTAAAVVFSGLGVTILTGLVLWSIHQAAIRRSLRQAALEMDGWSL